MKRRFVLLLILVMFTAVLHISEKADASNNAVKIQNEYNYSATDKIQNIIKGVDNQGNTVWTYSTGYYSEYSHCSYVVRRDKVYIFDGNTLIVKAVNNGYQYSKTYNIPTGMSMTEFDNEGNLYVIGAYESYVYKISSEGKLVWTARDEWIDYFHHYDMEVKNGSLYVCTYWSSQGYSYDVFNAYSTIDGSNVSYGTVKSYIEVGQTYHMNIDNKAGKEKIYIKAKKRRDYLYNFSLYINDKKVKTISDVPNMSCYIIDIQKGKKGKEIVFSGEGNNDITDRKFGIYTYRNGKMKKIGGNDYGYYSLIYMPEIKTNGNGLLTLSTNIIMDVGIGNYTGEIDLRLVKGKLKVVNPKLIKVDSVLTLGDEVLNLSKKTKVYQKAKSKSTVRKMLENGARVKILKLKLGKMKKTGNKYSPYTAKEVYAYIQDSSGNTGWIKIKTNIFQEVQYAG